MNVKAVVEANEEEEQHGRQAQVQIDSWFRSGPSQPGIYAVPTGRVDYGAGGGLGGACTCGDHERNVIGCPPLAFRACSSQSM
eukprot:SAG31_NODE_2684_length_5256_cov_2.975761_3_plen_83_part_00